MTVNFIDLETGGSVYTVQAVCVPREGELFSTMLKDYRVSEVKWIKHVGGLRALVYLKSL